MTLIGAIMLTSFILVSCDGFERDSPTLTEEEKAQAEIEIDSIRNAIFEEIEKENAPEK